jgi:type IV pilus assembly protein PilV
MLLEALIAILIFSIGILGVVGMQAMSVKQSTDARYRIEAALLAQQLLGRMWVSNRTATVLNTNFSSAACAASTTCTTYNTWYASVASTLPGVAAVGATAPEVTVGSDGTVMIKLRWLAPGDDATAPHEYKVITRISQS